MQGPSEFLQVKFADHEEFVEMGIFSSLAKAGKAAKWCAQNPKACKEKAMKKAKELKEKANELKEKAKKKLDDQRKINQKKPEEKPPKVVNDLDDLLSEEENVVEEEYDEETAAEPVAETSAPVVTNIVTEKKKIADLVLKASKDSEEYAQDMKHLIQFKSAKLPLEEQLMKGRPKYLKALKAYLKGDMNAEVKMSWSKNGKKKGRMVKVSELNPKRDSLKALLRSSAGNIRVVECV
jgi:hypothetical protein